MSGCDYCESEARLECIECEAQCCFDHAKSVMGRKDVITFCNPDPSTWPGRGCYKPPVAEVVE
jgi:hypothetical protein